MKKAYTDTCRRETKVNYTIDYSSYNPITAWGYVGYSFLWAIPVVGFICWLAECFHKKNRNVKNYARSILCMYVVMVALNILLVVAAFVLNKLGILDLSNLDVQEGAVTALANLF